MPHFPHVSVRKYLYLLTRVAMRIKWEIISKRISAVRSHKCELLSSQPQARGETEPEPRRHWSHSARKQWREPVRWFSQSHGTLTRTLWPCWDQVEQEGGIRFESRTPDSSNQKRKEILCDGGGFSPYLSGDPAGPVIHELFNEYKDCLHCVWTQVFNSNSIDEIITNILVLEHS